MYTHMHDHVLVLVLVLVLVRVHLRVLYFVSRCSLLRCLPFLISSFV
jgi:hypothetical protein